jgi:putative ABC transport system permease protein
VVITLHAIDRKLLRDIRRLWAQALAIALVLGCGVMIFLIGFGMFRALDLTRNQYYETNRFADVFASAVRAPKSLIGDIVAIDGVWAVETRTTALVVLDIEGTEDTALGRVLSLPPDGSVLNQPLVQTGRLPEPYAEGEVAVTAPFAKANNLVPGSQFAANLNGSKRVLTVTGTVLSPEFIYTLPPGGMMPDVKGFGILYMPEAALESAFRLEGGFNDLSVKLSLTANRREVLDRIDALLEPYGGMGAYERAQQLSHSFIDSEIMQLKNMTYILPPIFFGIAAFLVNMVLARIIALERSEIGLLKAFGYTDIEIAVHYILLAGLIAAVGILAGWAAGGYFGDRLAELYARFYDFPYLIRVRAWDAYALAALIGLSAAVIGAVRSAIAAARLPPAVAMQPPAPPSFGNGLMNRAISGLRVSQPTLMVLRGLVRWPMRAGMTAFGMALGVSVMVTSNFFQDSLSRIIVVAFYQANRQDVALVLSQAQGLGVLDDVRHLPGVQLAEPQFDQAAILKNGSLEKRVAITALPAKGELARLVDDTGQAQVMPDHGLLLSERLATQLNVKPGDMVEAEFTDGRRETHRIVVSGLVSQFFGLGAYLSAGELAALNRQSERAAVVNVTIDADRRAEFEAALKTLPNLMAHIMLADARGMFEETLRENVTITSTTYLLVSVMIIVGIAYNAARIQLSERARELASLRILGFTRAEVSYILFGEMMILALIAQPLGWLIGAGIARAIAQGFDTDLFRIPLVLTPANLAWSSLVALIAVGASIAVVLRRVNRLDLVAVMKTRE